MDDKRAKFLRVFANIPEGLREDILLVLEKKPYTWNTAYIEINNDTKLGQKMLKLLEKMGLL